jgi:hypothetical protein
LLLRGSAPATTQSDDAFVPSPTLPVAFTPLPLTPIVTFQLLSPHTLYTSQAFTSFSALYIPYSTLSATLLILFLLVQLLCRNLISLIYLTTSTTTTTTTASSLANHPPYSSALIALASRRSFSPENIAIRVHSCSNCSCHALTCLSGICCATSEAFRWSMTT